MLLGSELGDALSPKGALARSKMEQEREQWVRHDMWNLSDRSSRFPSAHHQVVSTNGTTGIRCHRGCRGMSARKILRGDSASQLVLRFLRVTSGAERIMYGDAGDRGRIGKSGEGVRNRGESDDARSRHFGLGCRAESELE